MSPTHCCPSAECARANHQGVSGGSLFPMRDPYLRAQEERDLLHQAAVGAVVDHQVATSLSGWLSCFCKREFPSPQEHAIHVLAEVEAARLGASRG